MPYVVKDTRLSKAGELVTVTNETHHPVMIVENTRGVRHSIRIENLSETPVLSVEKAVEPKVKESKKALTQAEKMQLEYLKSIGK